MKRALSPVSRSAIRRRRASGFGVSMIPAVIFAGEVVFGIWNLLGTRHSVNVQTAQGEASLLYDLAKFQFLLKR